jgi:hypothetical protein
VIDDKPIALDHGRAKVELTPGAHKLRATASTFDPVARALDIAAGTSISLGVHLQHHKANAPVDIDGAVDPFKR